ncbi:TetR/AcrR family transcriptional regulator [Schumannella luteola]|uniref:AcrR family transcriptional regulator n=1 Tax=Schumannella luteola TaxID=472059 RepID=A0A852Y9D3_9MICO|nr:TetR/AcrR family transcriptional regulator [Schumannella luteola]NYG98472.1 AcrR family transcriptional regulator [Schumannella luteola]TPX01302.1 TetR/AcrR family transcriptional regulator [Schumannella luteola]
MVDERQDAELSPRERIVRSTAHLMRRRGISGIGLREIVAHAGAARGSLQTYFPQGKNQLIEEAIRYAVTEFPPGYGTAIRTAETVADAVRILVDPWRRLLLDFDFDAGCPVTPVLIDGIVDERLREVAIENFDAWTASVQKVFTVAFDFDEADARAFAVGLVSSIEGAVLLCRARRDLDAFDDVERLFGQLGAGRSRRIPVSEEPAA